MESSLARSRLSSVTTGYIFAQAISCAAALGVADKLANGPRTVEELALETQSSTPHLLRLMRALCAIGVFRELKNRFYITDISEQLRKEVDGSIWPLAILHGNEMYRAFGRLTDNVKTGTPGWDLAIGQPIWEYLKGNADSARLFDSTMRTNHLDDVNEMVEAYDFSGVRVVIDVGGGNGSLLREVLIRHSAMSGVLFDVDHVVMRARDSDAWASAVSRCQFIAGDFFEGVPPGGDLYLMRHVLHDWDDDRCIKLLNACRAAISGSAKLLVIESLLERPTAHAPAAWFDLSVMVLGGQERSLEDYTKLLSAAHFSVERVVSVSSRIALIEVT